MAEFEATPNPEKSAFLQQKLNTALGEVAATRGGRNVVLYGSAFMQKQSAPGEVSQITHEDVNGFMSVIYGMDWSKGLTLILHTPGGVTDAVASIVEYLRSKFSDFEVIVPLMAMSAGTMISLASDRIVMGRQSQLGPIDPQMMVAGRSVSAQAIVSQFNRARDEVTQNVLLAHVWAPILQSLGPALLQQAGLALKYSEEMVASWLARYMFKDRPNPQEAGEAVASHFNDAGKHLSHGRRISYQEVASQGVVVELLEDNQALQEAVLTAYHAMTIGFTSGPLTKLMVSSTGQGWAKNWISPADQARLQGGAQLAHAGETT